MSDTLDIYGIEGHELQPVGEDFQGVKYYRQDDVQPLIIELIEEMTGLKCVIED